MVDQGTEEWKLLRLGKLTASRMADAMAKPETAARKNYIAQLVAERLTGQVAESFTNAAMAHGTEFEPIARAEYEIMTGNDVNLIDFVNHPTLEWCGASPDGLLLDDGLIEIKCPNTATHIDYLLGQKPPAKYVPQMALQLICTGRKWCDFASYDPRMPEKHRLFVVRYQPTDLDKYDAAAAMFLADVADTMARLERAAA
jgi:putative phage-type endonuclease